MLGREQVDQVNSIDQDAAEALPEYGVSFDSYFALAAVPNPKPSFTRDQAAAQIARSAAKWSADPDGITRVTYAYRSTTANLSLTSIEYRTFARFNESQINAFENILASWSDVANIVFTRVGVGTTGDAAYSNNAAILAANYYDPNSNGSAYAIQPNSNNRNSSSGDGDFWVNEPNPAALRIDYLSWGGKTMSHELGHAIGLSHPGRYNAAPGLDITYQGFAEYIEDSYQYTILSYFSANETGANHPGHSSAPMMDDIGAAQRKYGANMTTRTGDTVYGFNSTAGRDWYAASKDGIARPVIFCVWDAGGNDTLDFSGYGNDQKIDLKAESFSNVGGYISNVSIFKNVVIENAIGGSGHDTIYGNSGVNRLEGRGGNDVFIADQGNDIIDGGDGIDVFSFAGSGQSFTIDLTTFTGTITTPEFGTDTLISIEGFIGSSGNDRFTGGAEDNSFDGAAGNDILIGAAGNDTLIGGLGNDQLDGGAGMDIASFVGSTTVLDIDLSLYSGSNSGTITTDLGTDSLTSIEGIIGGSANDTLTGDGGANYLDGGLGDDILKGGLGDDIYVVDSRADTVIELAGQGTDTVRSTVNHTLLANFENLTFIGSANNRGDGNSLANVMIGNSGNNILRGYGGGDTLKGGLGNDTYVWDGDLRDRIIENPDEGTDSIQTWSNCSLPDNVENLWLLGSGTVNGTGNRLNNDLTGNIAANILDGGAGDDTMRGFEGDDTYVVDSVGDVVDETKTTTVTVGGVDTRVVIDAGGIDTVQASIDYTLGSYIENLTLIGTAAINGTGNDANNVITGNSAVNVLNGGLGDDTLDGGAGDDRLVGGVGDDTYVIDSDRDIIVELAGQGSDTIQAAFTMTLSTNNVENLTLIGSEAINGTGDGFDNIITGNSAANILSGGGGNDTLRGAAGDDIYLIDSGTVTVDETTALGADAGGTDTVQASLTYSLGAYVENLTLTGSAAINGAGNSLANILTGNSAANSLNGGAGNDTLDGGAGDDRLIGGDGDDTYLIDSAGDVIVEDASGGNDTVKISTSYTLSGNIENLILTGTEAINGTGDSADNIITGNSAANILSGGAGNDTLDGGGGDDRLIGGVGDDTYVIDSAGDVIVEEASGGNDTVKISASYTLSGNIENLILTGTEAVNGTGSGVANILTGNSAANILDGGAGDDRLIGGDGDDTYRVDSALDVVVEVSGQGTDTVEASVTHTLSVNVENLTLIGTLALNGTGNDAANILIGNSAANTLTGGAGNDTLDGGGGDDRLFGGTGNDTYRVDSSGDYVEEFSGQGTADTVQASLTYTLKPFFENLTLIGSDAINGTGNGADNIIIGNGAANVLNGAAGSDTLRGGAGDDTYVVDSDRDVVDETLSGADAGGIDTVQAGVTYSLGAYVENLTLTGILGINGTGNSLANSLTGNGAANSLDGGAGNDILDGGAGNDTLRGGEGDDTYRVDSALDRVIELSGQGTDTVEASVTHALSVDVENLTLTGITAINGTGNDADNIITGNRAANTLIGGAGNDRLDGGAGNDTLKGGAGNDTYLVDSASDGVEELSGEGIDTVQASVTYTLGANVENLILTGTGILNGTGNGSANTITGNSAANILDGGAGDDRLIGGEGNDTYRVDSTGDAVEELAGQGTDSVEASVTYTLSDNLENLTLTGTSEIHGTGNGSDNILIGNSAANVLAGGAGNDRLDGGAGNDRLIGGAGDDTYLVDSSGDQIEELSGEGMDTVQTGLTYSLGANLENLILTGNSAINGTGNGAANTITGNSAANSLDGGAGDDRLIGGDGDDTYLVDSSDDVIIENANQGADTVKATFSYRLSDNLENLTLTGASELNGTGNGSDNTIIGNSAANVLAGGAGNDTLDGGLGDDRLIGGVGDDTYLVDSAGDVIVEEASGGNDTVKVNASYILSDNVENLILTGTGILNGTGNGSANTITGNSAANILDGGAGDDRLIGGEGDDTYRVDSTSDLVEELARQGTDSVEASVTYTLSDNLENLTLTGASEISGTGNGSDNILTGNSAANRLNGGAGNDTLDGGLGDDRMIGGTGDDLYLVDSAGDVIVEEASGGNDTVKVNASYTLSDNLENLILNGNDSLSGTGNGSANTITGNSAANILDGGAGDDRLIGGEGDDTYRVDSTSDLVEELALQGTDTVEASVTYTLSANVENLTLTGIAANNGTGNDADNILIGNSAINILTGGAGNDTLDGGAGDDRLIGGDGDDTYLVDSPGDVIVEDASGGNDTVKINTSFTLSGNIENLILTGTGNLNGTGNADANIMTGNSSANSLDGGAGNDTLDGGAGDDRLIGGTGDDIFLVDSAGDVIVENAGEGIDTVKTAISYTLSANLENLTLTGGSAIDGTGNGDANIITGNSAANSLDGGAGADRLIGGGGDDTYLVDSASDVIVENAFEGMDTVKAGISYILSDNLENLTLTGSSAINGTGNSGANTLIGNSAANVLDGGAGNDRLIGGAGDDTYLVDSSDDVIVENANEGADTVNATFSYTLSDNLENLTLSGAGAINGTGNSAANTIIGNSAGNILDGGAGNDRLIGGAGDDTYLLDSPGDVVVENANEGIDTVKVNASYTLSDNLENLTLTGNSTINGTGNSGANIITGNSAANILDGGAGNDRLIGGAGNDTYVVDSSGDVIVENANEGSDTVRAGVSYILANNLENLTLTGTAAINGTGNGAANSLTGNSAANILDGGAGDDRLIGGAGDDVYVIDTIGDVVVENANEGSDTVRAGISYILADNLENLTLSGTGAINGTGNGGANILTGNGAANILDGGAGDDRLIGGGGDDVYLLDSPSDVVIENADEGIDTVKVSSNYTLSDNLENVILMGTAAINGTGNSLNNSITGNSAANVLQGGAGNDILSGEAGDDFIDGGEGDDTLFGGADNDGLVGGAGNDKLDGGDGDDNLLGQAGDDAIDGGTGSDFIDGGDGFDTISGGDGNDTVNGANGNDVINGDGGDDAISGDDGNDIIFGGLGNDVIDGGNDDDTISAGLGDDRIRGGNGRDVLNGGDGNDEINGDDGNDILYGNDGNDFLGGGLGDDSLIGGAGDDGIAAGEGHDSLDGGDGDDTLLGQAGDDMLSGGIGRDFIDGGDGADTVNAGDDNDLINGGNGNDVINGDAGSDSIYGDAGNDFIDGGAGDDDLSGGNDNDTILGGAGHDRLAGGYGNDVLSGGDGNDTISANDGDDTISGGQGVDNLYGFTGNDTIDGGDGGDTLLGMEGDDKVLGGAGADYIVGGDGTDTLYGDDGDDNMQGNDGSDTLNGGLGNDGLDGGSGNDTINGDAGNDYLGGGEGNDILSGGDGNDVFVGGVGLDTLTGGAGADAFFFTAATDSTAAATDKITDFSWAEGDYIDLSRIDANTTTAGDQAFSFVNSFTKQAGQATLTYDSGTKISTFSADINGDGVADFVLQINGQQNTSSGWVL